MVENYGYVNAYSVDESCGFGGEVAPVMDWWGMSIMWQQRCGSVDTELNRHTGILESIFI